jgi:hypothetical protein
VDETQRYQQAERQEAEAAEARRREEEEFQETVHFARTEATLASITLQSDYERAMRQAADAEGAVAELMLDMAEHATHPGVARQLEQAAQHALASQKATVSRLRRVR